MRTILHEIERHNMDYVVNEDLAAVIESLTDIRIDASHLFSGKPQATGDDVMITYGGDGTLLEGVALLPAQNIPVVGINCGRLGYLTADDGEGIEELFSAIAERRLRYEERLMLTTEGMPQECLALNEICIHRYGASMISVETLINDNYVATYHGDGLVVATPTGSTAYSLSAGGPIIDPKLSCFCATPICPHSLGARPLVFSDAAKLQVKNICTREKVLHLTVDGRATFDIFYGDVVQITRSELVTKLVRIKDGGFYSKIKSKKFV